VIAATAMASVLIFLGGLAWSRVVEIARESVAITLATNAAVRDSRLDDRARERTMREASVRLAGLCASLLLRAGGAVLASFVPIWIASMAGVVRVGDVVAWLSRWQTALAATALGVIAYTLKARMWRTS
jgi:hypothetical protein